MLQPTPNLPLRLQYSVDIEYAVRTAGTDFIFNVQAARTHHQLLQSEQLTLSQDLPLQAYTDPATATRHLRLRAYPGTLHLHYDALLDITHYRAEPGALVEVWIPDLPGHVLPYLYPSRYCESDRLNHFAMAQFGSMWQGYSRVQAIQDWVQSHVQFTSNSTSGTTSACDTLIEKRGVCRDFAHLMIALCRAVNIPARFTTGIDYGADPALGPQDFHAYVEAYVGHRWYLFDPSGTAIPMGFIRLATGRDAADAAFASIFGGVDMQHMSLQIHAVPGIDGTLRFPTLCSDALSTDDGIAPRLA
ncbi:MAG: transglutaminase-like domain-containing protein [Burkholderiaceae bacterium]